MQPSTGMFYHFNCLVGTPHTGFTLQLNVSHALWLVTFSKPSIFFSSSVSFKIPLNYTKLMYVVLMYLIGILHRIKECFTPATVTIIMAGENWTAAGGNPQPPTRL